MRIGAVKKKRDELKLPPWCGYDDRTSLGESEAIIIYKKFTPKDHIYNSFRLRRQGFHITCGTYATLCDGETHTVYGRVPGSSWFRLKVWHKYVVDLERVWNPEEIRKIEEEICS